MIRTPRASTGTFASALVLTLAPVLAANASAQTQVIFTEYEYQNPTVRAMELDGGNPQLLFQPPASEWLPIGCEYDASAGLLYWTNGNFNAGTIRRANLDGSGMELLLSSLKLARGMALDLQHGKMYWTNSPAAGNASGLVQRANLDGSSLETVFALDPYDPLWSFVGRPAVDPVNGYVYFCANGEIRRVQLDGTPPVQTVVRGVTTVTGLALDVASDHIYFVDANTNSDYLGRARLNDTEFTVLVDASPGIGGSSGLVDVLLDLAHGKVYWSDELDDTISRADLDGSDVEVVFSSVGGLSPTNMTLDVNTTQPMQDCNNNSIRDLDDIVGGASPDCNVNGIPDECEDDPCAPEEFLVDHGSNPDLSARSLSGNPATGYEIFQRFDVDDPEVTLERIGVDGHTLSYHPAGFSLTLFPDDGSGTFPDENLPIASTEFQVRFSLAHVVWVYEPFTSTLAQGRYWVRLTANDPTYTAGIHSGTSGPPSLSRRLSTGQITQASTSIALRVDLAQPPTAVPDRAAGNVWLSAAAPNPMTTGTAVSVALDRPARLGLSVFDPSGRLVRKLDDGVRGMGRHLLRWDGTDETGAAMSSGIYFLRVSALGAGNERHLSATRRVLIVR